jgi:hypothetical protein
MQPGPAIISWIAPTVDTNGNPLTGAEAITGFDVYQSTTAPVTTSSTLLTATPLAANATQFTTPNLPAGTYYFAVNALIGSSAGVLGQVPELIVPTVTVTVTPAAPGTLTVTYSSSSAAP